MQSTLLSSRTTTALLGGLAVALSAGSAVKAQNLVVNGDFSAGNSGFTSGYANTGAGSGQGAYSILSNPSTIGAAWGNYGDHTTGTGNMMVLNGAASATTNFWAETVTVATNTTYTFSGWVANATFAPLGDISFNVNGSSIGDKITTSSQGDWELFTGTWNSGASTTANLSLTDLQTAASGNDFSVDDISFKAAAGAAPEPESIALLLAAGLPLVGLLRSARSRTNI